MGTFYKAEQVIFGALLMLDFWSIAALCPASMDPNKKRSKASDIRMVL